MAAHITKDYSIGTAFNMVLDEMMEEVTENSMAMNTSADCNSPREQPPVADCYATPLAVPISQCTSTSEESSPVSPDTAMSITGKFSDIECKYHVHSQVLGTGFHGSVRECTDRITGKRYAVKSIRKSDPNVKHGSLAREIMLLQEMNHKSILQFVDVFEDENYVHIVTDLCTGGELFDKIVEKANNNDSSNACFAEDEAARIIAQVLKAVSYMHKHGIVHRDLKPENILFDTKDEDSPLKIIDFGLARKHYGDLGEPYMKTIAGTPYYIAPEVLRKRYNRSCDLWSVGVVTYILLSGYPPFNGRNNEETHRSVLRGRYQFKTQEWDGVSLEAKSFIRRLLRMDPTKRMTAEEALNHPWILKHTNTVASEEMDSISIVADSGVLEGSRVSKRGSMISGSVTRRLIRKAMFGV